MVDKWTPESAESFLGKRVKIAGKVIEVKAGSVGIKGIGALDYLENYAGYIVKWIK